MAAVLVGIAGNGWLQKCRNNACQSDDNTNLGISEAGIQEKYAGKIGQGNKNDPEEKLDTGIPGSQI